MPLHVRLDKNLLCAQPDIGYIHMISGELALRSPFFSLELSSASQTHGITALSTTSGFSTLPLRPKFNPIYL